MYRFVKRIILYGLTKPLLRRELARGPVLHRPYGQLMISRYGAILVRLEMSVTKAHGNLDFSPFDNRKVLVVGHYYYMVRQ